MYCLYFPERISTHAGSKIQFCQTSFFCKYTFIKKYNFRRTSSELFDFPVEECCLLWGNFFGNRNTFREIHCECLFTNKVGV